LGACEVGGSVLLGDCVRVVLVGKVAVTFSAAGALDGLRCLVECEEGGSVLLGDCVRVVLVGKVDVTFSAPVVDSVLDELEDTFDTTLSPVTFVGFGARDGAADIDCATVVGAIDSTLWEILFVSLFVLLGKEGPVSFPLLERLGGLGAMDGGADDGGVAVSNSVDELLGDNTVVVF